MGFKWFTSTQCVTATLVSVPSRHSNPVIFWIPADYFRFPEGFQKVKCSAARTPKRSEAGTSR